MVSTICYQGTDVDVEVAYTDGWFARGRYTGPPELCYEDEGEMPTLTAVMLDGADILPLLDPQTLSKLEADAWDDQTGGDRGDL